MTKEEMAEVLKMANACRPAVSQTMNFNAPIGQHISHVDKIEAHFDKNMGMQVTNAEQLESVQPQQTETAEELFHFIHPAVFDDSERMMIHKEVENLVRDFSIPNICRHLNTMDAEKRILKPADAKTAIAELHRMGMPGEKTKGFSFKNFCKYYKK